MKTFLRNYPLSLLLPFLSLIATTIFAQSGTVFRDYNGNGTFDTGEGTVAGVLVKSYNASNTLVGSATSAINGTYTLSPAAAVPVRIEFDIPSSNTNFAGGNSNFDFPSYGAMNVSNVQFVSGNVSGVNFAVNYAADYVQNNPIMVTPQFINGDPLVGGNAATFNALTGTYYNKINDNNPDIALGLQNAIGSTWGVAYRRSTKQLYIAASVHRHAGLGPQGLGGIYRKDMNNLAGAPVNFVNVSNIGINVGTIGTNSARGLTGDAYVANTDAAAFAQVGKIGIGGLDISDDESKLWLINLSDKKLYSIVIDSDNNIATAPTAADVASFTLPNPATNGNSRPWVCKVYRGMVYVGIVTDAATSQNVADLKAFIYRFDGTTFTQVLTYNLNYAKGCAINGNGCAWKPWTDTYNQATMEPGGNFPAYPMPLISDIEFDNDGTMIIAMLDRFGSMIGHRNNRPDGTGLITGGSSGDILRAAWNGTAFTLESNGSVGGRTGSKVGNAEGPGGGEFYGFDNLSPTNDFHEEISSGGLALFPGKNEIVLTAMDPVNDQVDAQGFQFFSNLDGADNKGVQILQYNGSPSPLFAKQNGIGDMEFISAPAPIVIGNRVWADTDADGIQDAGENGLPNVIIELYNGTTKIAQTTTDNNGNYQFNNLSGATSILPNTAYTIRIASSQYINGASVLGSALNGGVLSPANVSTGGVADVADSDATVVSGIATIPYTTGAYGANSYNQDFGFSGVVSPPILCESRVTSGLVAYYDFMERTGNTISDRSNFGTALNLTIANTANVTWQSPCGLSFNTLTVAASATSAAKITDALKATNEVTVEAWVIPANVTVPASGFASRIVSISLDQGVRNITLGQLGPNYVVRVRNPANTNGTSPEIVVGGAVAGATQHLVFTHDDAGNEKLYLNGTVVYTGTRAGDFSTWDNTYKLYFANEATNDREWLGKLHTTAFYRRDLSLNEVQQNYNVGKCAPTTSFTAAAGGDQSRCGAGSFTMVANTPPSGVTGTWSVVSGSATITTPSSPTTTITGVANNSVVVLRWTLTNGTCTSTDDVQLTANNNSISASTSAITCNNNGTPTTPIDDTFTFTMTVTGSGASGWTSTDNQSYNTGSYGVAKTMGPYPISGGNVTVQIKDAANPTCATTSTVVTAPATCSNTCPDRPCSTVSSVKN